VIPYNRNLVEAARNLRNHPTAAEKRLWQRIQLKHLGYKFYRQKPIGEYIVDFFCPKAKLVVEVDGAHHFTAVGKGNDKVRDEYINSFELMILRFSNSEVLASTDKVVERINQILLNPPFKKGDNPKVKSPRTSVNYASSPFVKELVLSEVEGESREGLGRA
jgi:very-short-patch-repair endonuclease